MTSPFQARPRLGAVVMACTLVVGAATARAQTTIEISPAQPANTPMIEQIGIERPRASGRVVKVFDFEEAKTNPGAVPQNWFRAQDGPGHPRPGFPAWNQAEFSYTNEQGQAFAGDGSVRLPTQGGSTSLMLGEGVLPVFQNADYLLSARVRTEGFHHARAGLVGRFLDRSGHVIPGSEVRTPLVASAGAWQSVTVELVGDHDNAAYIQLELQVLQPEQASTVGIPDAVPPGPRTIWEQDYSGAAWFDEVAVVQLPRVELTTSSPVNIVTTPDQPELRMLVRDLTGEALTINIQVIDVWGHEADHLTRKIGAGFTSTTWKPKLTQLGWYRARMEITTQSGSRVGREFTDFIWVPGDVPGHEITNFTADPVSTADRARLGLIFENAPGWVLGKAPQIVRSTGAGAVTLPVWDAALSLDHVEARAAELGPIIDALYADRQQITLSLERTPDTLAQAVQVETQDPWVLLIQDPKRWMAFAAPIFERFGQRVNRWQVGRVGDDRVFWRKELPAELVAMTGSLGKLVPGPVITIPTLAERQWPARGPGSAGPAPAVVASVGPEVTPEAVGLALNAWSRRGGEPKVGELMLAFEPLPPARFGADAGATLAAKRAIEFWAACSEPDGKLARGASMALVQAWDESTVRRPQLLPRPELAVWRSLVDRLAGRRIVGRFPAGQGVVCYILAPAPGAIARGGALVAWSETAQDAFLTADFGDGTPRVVDIFGNERPVPRLDRPADHALGAGTQEQAARPLGRVPLSGVPAFVEGVNVELCRFIAGFAVESAYLESSNDQHERELVITNPWPTGITGTLTILEPGGFDTGQKDRTWRISPRSQRFAVGAGKTERLPFKVSFSPVEEVGPKDFVVAVDLSADRQYGSVEIHRTIEVGVKSIGLMLSTAAQGVNGQDLVVEAMISNLGPSPMTLELTAFAKGFPRSKASVSGLTPGNQVIKRFTYPGAAAALKGEKITLALSDPENGLRVNKSVVVP